MDLPSNNGILTQLQLIMMNDDVSSDPPTPPEPDDFFDGEQTCLESATNETVDYYALLLKSRESPNLFESRPKSSLTSHSSNPNFLLGPPPTSSSSSRDPSPNAATTASVATASVETSDSKKIKRRYVPFSQNRKFTRKPTTDQIPCSRSVEDFRFGEILAGAERSRWSPQTPSSPLTVFPTKPQGSVVRKVSIRRMQRPSLIFDDQETQSSDEMSNLKEIQCNKLRKSLSGSLPHLLADIYCKPANWQEDETPSTSNPLLNKNMISSTVGIDGSDGDFQVLRVPTVGNAGDTSSEHSICSDKVNELPHSAPPLNNNESLFVFERRKSLVQELPAISEDQLADEKSDTWHSANDTTIEFNNSDGYLHKRSTSDYVVDKPSPTIERRCSEKLPACAKMKVISGNPNFSDTDDSSKLDSKSNGTLKSQRSNGTSMLDYAPDFADTVGRQKASSLVLQQDGSKNFQLVETKSDYSELKTSVCSGDVIDSIPSDLPDQGTRKARILKRKTKLKRHKSSLRAIRAAPITSAVDHISPSLLKNVEVEENQQKVVDPPAPIVILRQTSVQQSLLRKRSGTDKKKEQRPSKIFSLFGSTRVKERKDTRSIFHNETQNGATSVDRKRYSLAEGMLNRNSTDALPDVLAFLSSTSESDLKNGTMSSYSSVENGQWPQLLKKKWADLDLFTDDFATWTERFPELKLTTGEEKRQNIIYEFYTTEKRHCQVLVFMQQIFQVGLLAHNILTPNEIKALIPDVIDSLLDFHLNLLRQVRQRIFEDSIVSTISDIVYEEFKNSENRAAAIKGYTDFCFSRDSSDLCYNDFINKNSNFRLFCENLEQYPVFKKKNFKSCFLLIIQRLTKYPSLIEQMIKYESTPENKLSSQRALTAVRNFALRVDRELSCQLLNRRYDQVRSMIDRNSIGKVLGQKFTASFDDLVMREENDFHKILSIGTVQWQSVNHQNFELTMLLFDDIIVFLQNKNNSLHFFTHKDHSSVLPLHVTLIREMPRSNMVMLIVVAMQQTPDMYQLKFSSRNEMEQWLGALNTAQKSAPKYVKMANRKLYVKGNAQASNENDDEQETEEEKYNALLTKWQDKLDSIFLEQMNGEPKLLQYMEERMRFLDNVRTHLTAFPFRPQPENKTTVPSTAKSRDSRERSRMKAILNSHFMELRAIRRSQLDKLVEHAQKSRDNDLISFFDDLHEIGHPNNVDSATFSSSSDESRPSTSIKPRRTRTWNIGNIADSHQNEIIRRHTTVPKFSQQPGCSTSEQQDSISQEIDERMRKFSLNTNSKARRAATEIIRENVALRLENDRLRSENALHGIHLAALRGKKTAFETTEKLEVLRQKKEEVQAKELEFKKEYEKRLKELIARENELDQKEAELKEREQQVGKENFSYDLADLESINSSGLSQISRDISRDTSFRSGAVIFNSSPTIPIQTSRSSGDVVLPKHLAETTKEKRAKK